MNLSRTWLWLILAAAAPAAARADWWIETGSGYQSIGGARVIGPYESKSQAEQVNRQYFNGQARVYGQDNAPSGGGGGGAPGGRGGGTGDPMVDAMAPVLEQGASLLGQALAKALFGDPQEEARKARERAWREANEAERHRLQQQFEGDMARKEQAEQEHLRAERHRKIERILKRLSNGVLADESADDASGVDLRPAGTAFFGLGGGSGSAPGPEDPPSNDPMVVDLRHLRQGAYLAEAAESAPPGDAPIFLDQAVAVAQGEPSFIRQGPPDTLPTVNPEGLAAFQKANAEYRKEHDSRYILEKKAQEARARREALQLEMDAAAAKKRKDAALQRRIEEMEVEARAARQAALQAQAEADAARAREALGRAALRQQLREIAVPSPVRYSDILRGEREAMAPSAADRMEHAAWKAYADASADAADRFLGDSYAAVDDPELQARLDRLLARLRDLSPYPGEPSEARILGKPVDPGAESGQEKGACATSKRIYVGIDFARATPPPTDDELMFVMAHETAHVHKDHYAKANLADRYERVRQRAQGAVGTDPAPLGEEEREWVHEQTRKARLGAYYREQEQEADRFGALMALSAGAKPEGIRSSFAHMHRDEGAWTSRIPNEAERKRIELTRDHDTPEVRFEKLRKIYGKPLGEPIR